MEKLLVGKIVNTHGIRGEVKILSNFKYINKVFKKDMILYTKHLKTLKINTMRLHKNFILITFENIININDVLEYKGFDVFINRNDLVFEKGEYLINDIMDFEVLYNDEFIGKVVGYYESSMQEVLELDTKALIPNVDHFIKQIDFDNKKIIVENVDGLI